MSGQKYYTKRSLSESSADEYYNKANLTKSKSGRLKKMWRNEIIVNQNSIVKQDSFKQCKPNRFTSDLIDIGIRVALVIVFIKLETSSTFVRKIHVEELWRYKNPRTPDFVSPFALLLSVIFGPLLITLMHFVITRNQSDFYAASWTWTLILGLNGLATSLLKITVGRPRPDFFYRCFPDGLIVLNNMTGLIDNGTIDSLNCTGNIKDINEGRKSFPSGHSSFAFAGFGFIALYIGAKLHAFSNRGRGQSWRFCITITPLVLATLIAVSRTCDYHHHWQDVLAGGIIGLLVSYNVYRQYYPSLYDENCDRPYSRNNALYKIKHISNQYTKKDWNKTITKNQCENNVGENCDDDHDSSKCDDHRPLI